jgi:SAM-dependent methyltransferase
VHDAALEWIRQQARPVIRRQLQLGLPFTILDIGGRDINGSPRGLFPESVVAAYTVLDALPGEKPEDVDIIADAAEWNPDGRRWDLIICAEVLEHTASWRAICRTAYAACAPGGRLIVTTAAPGRPPHSAVDGAFRLLPGEHYANIRPAELERVLAEAGWSGVVVDVQPSPADVRAVAVKE